MLIIGNLLIIICYILVSSSPFKMLHENHNLQSFQLVIHLTVLCSDRGNVEYQCAGQCFKVTCLTLEA